MTIRLPVCHSEEPKATWESQHPYCHSEGGHCPTVGVSPAGELLLDKKKEILTSRAQHAPRNDRTQYVMLNVSEASDWERQDISTTHIVHNQILHFVQNDIVGRKKSPQNYAPLFRQKRYYTTQTKIRRIGHTNVFPIAERRGADAECRFSRKREKHSRTSCEMRLLTNIT